MTKTYSGLFQSGLQVTFSRVALGTLTETTNVFATQNFAAAAGYQLYRAELTLADASPEDIDLLELVDAVGDALELDEVVALFVRNRASADGDDILVGPQGVADGWTAPWNDDADGVNLIPPGGSIFLASPTAPWPVELDSKILRLAHDGQSATITAEIYVLGTSDGY